MSKDVVIAGVIVAACLGLVIVAFVAPPKQKTPAPEIAKNDDPLVPTTPSDPLTPTNPSDPFAPIGPTTPTDPLLANNNPPSNAFTPIGEPNNPFNRPTNSFPPTNNAFNQPPAVNPFPPLNQPPLTPVEPPIKPETSEAKSHVIASGETLGEISAKYYGSAKHWKKIAEANKVDPSDLQVGQKLTIPAMETAAPTTSTPELAGGERTYTVQKNDSYYSIAKKELGSAARWKELEKLNGIPAEELRVGKVIKLPAKAAAVDPIGPAPEAPSAGDANVHVVAAGETLSDISKKHYGTTTKWKEIVKANPGLDPEGLKVGQKIKLPEIAGTTPTPSTGGSAPADNPAATYTVKAGEYLEDIAQSQLGSRGAWKKIVDANPGLDPKKLRIGQKLVIPGKSAPAETTPPPASNNGFGTPSNNGFGTPSNNGFGTPSNNGFGTPSNNGFGTQPSNSGFGTQPSNSGFGTQPSGSPSSFGSQPSNNSFGTSPSGSPSSFGSQPSTSPSSFGSTPAAGGSTYPAPPSPSPVNDNPFGLPPAGGSTRPTP
jgi:LysM repeat protein